MKLNKKISKYFFMIMVLFFVTSFSLYSVRIKDIADIQGVSHVQAIGYGLVTGLNNTGDNQQTSFTVQSVSNMLKRFGLTVPQSNPRIRNVAAVMVTATIPVFLKPGSKIDITVSSIGDANSLQGGVLIMTPISSSNGDIIGMAQGALSVGGYDFQAFGSRVGRNFVTTGRVPSGLILDKPIIGNFITGEMLTIVLRQPDFTTSVRIAEAINAIAGLQNTATPMDAANIQVQFPPGQAQMKIMQNIVAIDTLNIENDIAAKVVINERTGTIVIGGNVQLLPAVIAHGGLEIQIQKNVVFPPQPPAYPNSFMPQNYVGNQGNYNSVKVWYPRAENTSDLNVLEDLDSAHALNVPRPATVQDIALALNTLQVKPRDLISIFQALKESGVLQAELIIQ